MIDPRQVAQLIRHARTLNRPLGSHRYLVVKKHHLLDPAELAVILKWVTETMPLDSIDCSESGAA